MCNQAPDGSKWDETQNFRQKTTFRTRKQNYVFFREASYIKSLDRTSMWPSPEQLGVEFGRPGENISSTKDSKFLSWSSDRLAERAQTMADSNNT